MKFEWDSGKAASNLRKHGVSFEEARTVFHDANLLIVCHCERGDGDVIRIISARKATRSEAHYYRAD